MGFMEKQITRKLKWIEVDSHQGTFFIPTQDAPQTAIDFAQAVEDGLHDCNEPSATAKCDVMEFTDCFDSNHIFSIQFTEGYGGRMSAPGYMDCTEWSVFDSPEEANEYMDEMYGEED